MPCKQRLSVGAYACGKRAVAKACALEVSETCLTMHNLRCRRCQLLVQVLKLVLAY